MSRASRRRLYKSKAWQKCRDAYYISRFGICERCGGPGVIVHHKIPITAELPAAAGGVSGGGK